MARGRTYSDRELDQLFKASNDRSDAFREALMQRMDVFESNTSTLLNAIEKQTKMTNGHVADAFRDIGKLKTWQTWILGFVAAIMFFGTVFAFIFGQVLVPILSAYISAGKL